MTKIKKKMNEIKVNWKGHKAKLATFCENNRI